GSTRYISASSPKEGTNIWVDNFGAEHDVFSQAAVIKVINKPLVESLELKRVTGRLEFNFLDGIPDNIERIEYSIANVSSTYYPLRSFNLALDPIRRAAFKSSND